MKINILSPKNLLITVVVLIVVFFGVKRLSTPQSNLKFNPKKDTIYSPKIGNIKDSLILAASIDTDQIAQLRFPNAGKLVWVGVKVGDRVRRGQAIASLDREQLKKNLQTQYNNYRSQLSQFNDIQDQYRSTRDKVLVTDTIQRILDRTQYSLDNSVINYEITDMAIKESVLVSPINGIVTNIDQPLAGTNILPATATFTIVNPEKLFFKAEIDQSAVTKVKTGQSATLKLDSFPDKTIESRITYIAFSPIPGQTSTVYEIRFELPLENPDLEFRLGMDGDATIILNQSDNALIIPTDAVLEDNGQNFVYTKDGNNLVRKNISVGIQNDTDTEITAGLTSNDQVVVSQK